MEAQTDGVEWVLAALFIGGAIAVLVSAVREIASLRRGDLGGDDEEDPQ